MGIYSLLTNWPAPTPLVPKHNSFSLCLPLLRRGSRAEAVLIRALLRAREEFFNSFKEKGSKPFRLVTSAIQGDRYEVEFTFQNPTIPTNDGGGAGSGGGGVVEFVAEDILKTSEPILESTPGTFRVTLAHAERPHRSQAPLFYQDDKRSFFVVPQGKYTGGPGGGLADELTIELNTAPLELPDVLSHQVFTALAVNNAGPTRNVSRTGRIGTILAPQVSAARAFQPVHWEAKRFRFHNFYHPFVDLLIEQLNRFGVEGILRPDPERESSSRRAVVANLRRQRNRKIFSTQSTGQTTTSFSTFSE